MYATSKFHSGIWAVVCGLLLLSLFVARGPCLAEEELASRVEFSEERLSEKISLDYKSADLNSVLRSIAWNEHTQSYWGPPQWPIKMFVPIGGAVLLIAGISKFIKDLYIALGRGKL